MYQENIFRKKLRKLDQIGLLGILNDLTGSGKFRMPPETGTIANMHIIQLVWKIRPQFKRYS